MILAFDVVLALLILGVGVAAIARATPSRRSSAFVAYGLLLASSGCGWLPSTWR